MDLRDRYEHYVDRRSSCHLWTGPTDTYGYGVLKVAGKMRKATHIGWELLNDQPFPGPMICHTCDEPLCQNPQHWYIGGHRENNADKVTRNRCSRLTGERNGRAKITWEMAEKLRADYTGRYGDVRRLAKQFNLPEHIVSDVVRGRTWVNQRKQ